MRQMNDGPLRWRPGRTRGSARVGANRTRLTGPPPFSPGSSVRVRLSPRGIYQLAGYRRGRQQGGRQRALIALLVIAVTVGTGALLRVDRSVATWLRRDREVSMRALVGERRFREAVEAADLKLARWPLDPEANLIRGVSALYVAISAEATVDEPRNAWAADGGRASGTAEYLLATAVVSLRRALLDLRIATGEPAAQYAMGKAYYHRGYFYYDLAVRYLEGSLALGYDGADTYEYLGLAYTKLGDPRGLEFFLRALTRRPSSLLHLKMATILMDQGDVSGARENLIKAIKIAGDSAIEQRARYELGAIYRLLGELPMAEEQYRAIIAGDERAADAHFYLGEIYSLQGDSIRARGEWRAARDLDPNHRRANELLR